MKQNFRVSFVGSFDVSTRGITLTETEVLSGGNSWKLGTDKGAFSTDGKIINGTGSDGRSTYSWRFAKQ